MHKFVFGLLFALVIAACSGHPGHHNDPEFEKLRDECKAQIETFKDEEKKKNPNCLMGCLQKKWGSMTADNKYDPEAMKMKFEEMKQIDSNMKDDWLENMVGCAETVNADEKNAACQCKAAQAFEECMKAKMPEHKHP